MLEATPDTMPRELLLLTDYKGEYWVRHKRSRSGTDLRLLEHHLARRGFSLRTLGFDAIDFRHQSYAGKLVLYQSSQDPGLYYRSYIEDVVLGLELAGAKTIPSFRLLRAHHNKVFMEILRDQCGIPEAQTLRARAIGTYEDLCGQLDRGELRFPCVLKLAASDSGSGVVLARDAGEARRQARRLGRSLDAKDLWDNVRYKLSGDRRPPHSLHRRKLIAQEFVPGLDHDYKTVVLGQKYFVTMRPTRPNDFRASGSRGERAFPERPPAGLLELTRRLMDHFRPPFASIDMMYDGSTLHLGEFQFLRFGTNPVIKHRHCFVPDADGGFQLERGPFEWERELADAIADHIEREAL